MRTHDAPRCIACGRYMMAKALYQSGEETCARCICDCGWSAPIVTAENKDAALAKAKAEARAWERIRKPRPCATCERFALHMPHCQSCEEENGYKYYKKEGEAGHGQTV